jgi:FkbM family methyltransferase
MMTKNLGKCPALPRVLKTCVKNIVRHCGLDIKRASSHKPYEWLRTMSIRTVLDIGANTGQFASQIHRILPDATIYSFEPIEDCYRELLKRMKHIPKFHAINFALGNRNGQAKIYRNDFTPSSSLLPMEELHKRAFPFTAHVSSENIEIRRLDDILGDLDIVKNVLIKMDVQGTEDKIILGGEKLLSRASILIVETSFQTLYKDQPLFDTIYDLLREREFVFMGSEQSLRNPKDGSILQSDCIFVRATNHQDH